MKLPSKKYLKARDVAEMLSVSESAIYKWASGDNFPKPYKMRRAAPMLAPANVGNAP